MRSTDQDGQGTTEVEIESQTTSNEPSLRETLKQAEASQSRPRRRQAESSDWIASALTRRFGIAGGLAWLGFLTFGVVSEQVKTRLEIAAEEAGTKDVDASAQKEVVTPEGIRYVDLKAGGGAFPQRGFLTVVNYKAYANGQLFEDTYARGKPIVFFYEARPLTGGVCPGVEIALRTMRAGGKRRVKIPPELGFGDNGITLRATEHVPEKRGEVPPGATLEYELELVRVSIPPS